MLLGARPATASDLPDLNATHVTLAVHGGTALVTYTTRGTTRHVFVWGAVNALTPGSGKPQVRFKHDYSGGLHSLHRAAWVSFVDECTPYIGPKLAYFVAGCTAPDGSYWAVQRWQRNLPHRGFTPWTDGQRAWELHLSHWTGPLAQVELDADWAFDGAAHGIFGRLSYGGAPVHGFHTASSGAPLDSYGRSLYIDTRNSSYGPRLEPGDVDRLSQSDRRFLLLVLAHHDVSLPGSPPRPAGNGDRYRISVVGPGVTPDVVAEAADPGAWNPNDRAKVTFEQQQLRLFNEVTAGDKFCATQR
jgi:hypothetical protein